MAGSDLIDTVCIATPHPLHHDMAIAALRAGGWLLNGQKRWITNAGHASGYTGFATIDPALKHKGITAFVVERGTPGFTASMKRIRRS